MKIRNILSLILPVCFIAACQEDPVHVADKISVKSETLNFESRPGTSQIVLESSCAWTAKVDESWVSISPDHGQPNTRTITVSVEENTGESSREAKVSISAPGLDDVIVKILQNGPAGSFDGHIRTADDMQTFLASAVEMAAGEKVELDADIDMGGIALTPAVSFAGEFEGNGHSVYNFTITSNAPNAGLITENRGTVRNLSVGTRDGKTWDGVTTISFGDVDQAYSIGLVAVNYGLMEGVKNFASIEFNVTSPSDDFASVGGVCGRTGSPDASFKNCENYGRVSLSGVLAYKSAIAGVLGLNANADVTVSDCANFATIAQSTNIAKEYAMAGVVGRCEAKTTISSCRNEGSVRYECTEAPGSYLHIAGIVAAMYNDCEVSGCLNKADIYSALLQVNRMGGIVGTVNTGGSVVSCVNEGDIIVDQATNANWQAAAGIAGFEEKGKAAAPTVVRSCTNKGKVLLALDNTTTHANKVSAAGVMGLCCSVVQLMDNVNEGSVKCTNTGATPVYAGGITGSYIKAKTLSSSGNLNTAEVAVEAADGAAGGVAGFVAINGSDIKEETNRGEISCSNASACGSIAGLSASALTACAVGGVVNSTVVTAGNFPALIQGSSSTGTPVGCYFDGEAPASYLNVSPAALDFIASGGTENIAVESNCDWTVRCSETWLTVDVAEGGEAVKSVSVTAAENTVTEQRSATVTFTAKDDPSLTAVVNVKQAEFVFGLPENKITSADDFGKFAALAPDAAVTDVYTLESDIVLGADFAPITSFAGTLDGKNHSVTLAMTSDGSNVGMIQTLSGTVKNLVTKGSVRTDYAGAAQHYVAALAAIVDGGRVENCTNNANIELASGENSKYAIAGGLVGGLRGDGATISNCSNSGRITVTGSAPSMAGGILGYGEPKASITISILDCTSSGDIELNHSAGNWGYAGGIVGKIGDSKNKFAKFTVARCTYSGTMSVIKAPKLRAGAIAGSLGICDDMEISGCSFTGTFDCSSTEAVDRLFGGAAAGMTETGLNGTVSSCTFDGTIRAVDGGNLYLGGVFGNSAAAGLKIDACKTTSRSSISGFTTAKSVGMVMARATNASLKISNCKIAGSVVDVTDVENVHTLVISADKIADWMFKGSASNAAATLENNGFNAE